MKITELHLKKLRVIAQTTITKGNKALADDILSGSLLYFYENYEKLKDHPNIIGYLIRKMKSLNIDHFRKEARYSPEDTNQNYVDKNKEIEIELKENPVLPKKKLEKTKQNYLYRNQETLEEKIDKNQKQIKLREFIKKMDEKCSEILMMWIEDLSRKEIADILGIKLNTVLTRIYNCRKKLFPLFEND